MQADGQIAEVRGVGAVWAAGMRPDINAMEVRDHLLNAGVIVRNCRSFVHLLSTTRHYRHSDRPCG